MVVHIRTIAFHGVDALAVDVQVHLAPGQNAFNVVGLPDKSVGESDIATAMAWRRLASIAQI